MSEAAVVTRHRATLARCGARAYIDGFNLYYGAVRGHPNRKWLDLWRFCERLTPAAAELDQVHYFTTRVTARPNDPDGPTRQDTLLRALETLPGVHVHEGSFKSRFKRSRLVDPQPMGVNKKGRPAAPYVPLRKLRWPTHASAYNTEEKASDVNLATKLSWTATTKTLSGSHYSSPTTPMLLRPQPWRVPKGVRVLVVSPRGYWLRELAPNQTDVHKIHLGVIEKCQLPDPIVLSDGSEIYKPASW